jgi:KaiC/GvpD/RAD55 family RecA-like ATPase
MSDRRRREEPKDAIEATFNRYVLEDRKPELPKVIEEAQPQELKAPETAPEKGPQPKIVPTHIAGLDDLLGGGIPNNSLILIIGSIGSGYTTFINQLLHNNLNDGGKAAYYATETSSLDVEQEMQSFGWSLRRFTQNGSCAFINVLTPDLQKLAELAPGSFSQLRVNLSGSLNALKTDLLGKLKESRWTILDLNHVLQSYDLKEVIGLMLYWRAAVQVYGGVNVAVVPSGIHDERVENALKNVVDGVFVFRLREGPVEYGGDLIVQKLRGMRTAKKVSYTVSEEGIVVETAMRIR